MNKKLTNLLLGLIDGLDHDIENKQMKMIFKMQQEHRDMLLEKVADISLKSEVVENALKIPAKEKKELKKVASALIDSTTAAEGKVEEELIGELLRTTATERYLIDAYFYNELFEIPIKYGLKRLSDSQINNIINQKVNIPNSKVWSNLTQRNKAILNKQLRKELYNFMDGKTDINKISRNITDKYGQSFSRTRTLVRTESARVQSTVNDIWAKDNGIEQQMWDSTLDYRTSKICQDLDGEFFDTDDPNKPTVPAHPNCRSALINVPFKDWKPTVRRDNITKENINYVKYKEWASNQTMRV